MENYWRGFDRYSSTNGALVTQFWSGLISRVLVDPAVSLMMSLGLGNRSWTPVVP